MKQIYTSLLLLLIATSSYTITMHNTQNNQHIPAHVHPTNNTVVSNGYVSYRGQLVVASNVIQKKDSNYVPASTLCAMAGSFVGFALGHFIMMFLVGHGGPCRESKDVRHYYEHHGIQISGLVGSLIGAGIGNCIGSRIDKTRLVQITDNDVAEYKKQLDAYKKD